MQLIPLILLATLASGDNRIFELTAQAPSFAIHKDRLNNILKSFTIKVTDGSKILVDYTQRGCSKLAENKNCNDTLPFTIEGEIIEEFDEKDKLWNDGPISYLKPRNQYHQYPDPGCVAFKDALDCKDETIYESFAGSDPGSNPNENHQLLNGFGKYLNELVVYSRSTAATILTKVQCTFCLIYATTAFDQHQSMNRISIWTPPYYPWIHDNPDRLAYGADYRVLLGYFPPLLIQPKFTAEIRKLQGGALWFATLQSENPPLTPLYNASITSPIKDPIPLNGTFTQLLWCPRLEQMDKAGFMIVTKEDPDNHVRHYYLDDQTPSMAIHWVFMATFDSILIEIHEPSEILMDWTQYGCAGLDKLDNSTPMRPCADEVPFLLDGAKPDDGNLKQDVIPFAGSKQNNIAFTIGNYYTTHLKLSTRSKVVLTPVLTATNVEFAIAIRASNWVNVTKKLIVLPWRNPEHNDGSMLYIQMKEGWIATVVANPNAPIHGPYGVLKVVGKNYGPYQEIDCPVFRQKTNEEELSCPDETIYESFAGSDPGYSRNQRHFLVDGEAYELKVITRSSATTMQAKSECKYCLQFYMWDNMGPGYYKLSQMSIISPPWHPWIFDEVELTLFVTGGGFVRADIAGYV
ncbi:unnamed protein product, partial [Mesorhabditis belari]|uniref:Uncharacterized protein n=1 Tax=Mesorhabditis belari TaxID=2138241 RepID=A0AAF3FQ52_9BILA